MPFEKGKSGNEKGRPRGAKGRTTEELRQMLNDFVNNNIETLETDFKKLEPLQRLNFFAKLLDFVLPKPISSLENLSEHELDILLQRLKNQTNEERKN